VRAITQFTCAAAALVGAVTLAAPANAVTFANFTQTGTTKTVHWVRDANSGAGSLNGSLFTGPDATTHAGVAVKFNFQLESLADFSNLSAIMTLNAREVGHAATFTGAPDNVVTQTGVDGDTATTGFSIIYNGPTVVIDGRTLSAGANLLSGKFTNIWIQGVKLANAGAASDSDPTPGTITYTSDFINFANTTERGLSWDLTSISPVLNYQLGKAMPSFNASLAGSFSAAPIPEPVMWAMMIGGFGLAGAMLRQRRRMAFVRA
jgi:hypothetical protein